MARGPAVRLGRRRLLPSGLAGAGLVLLAGCGMPAPPWTPPSRIFRLGLFHVGLAHAFGEVRGIDRMTERHGSDDFFGRGIDGILVELRFGQRRAERRGPEPELVVGKADMLGDQCFSVQRHGIFLADSPVRARLKAQRITSVIQARDNPEAIGQLGFARVLYGTTHRYGTALNGTKYKDW